MLTDVESLTGKVLLGEVPSRQRQVHKLVSLCYVCEAARTLVTLDMLEGDAEDQSNGGARPGQALTTVVGTLVSGRSGEHQAL